MAKTKKPINDNKAQISKNKTDFVENSDKRESRLGEGDIELIQELEKAGVDSQTITRIAKLTLTNYSGPLPPPEILKAFDAIIPGSGEKIINQFEKEAEHRRLHDEKTLDAGIEGMRAEITENKRGQWMGYSLSVMIIAGAFILGLLGKEIAASIITSVGVLGMVTVFVVGKKYGKVDTDDE